MEVNELAQFLQSLDALDDRVLADGVDYASVAQDLVSNVKQEVRDVSLYLQRMDFLTDDRLADHPKYFEYLAREILGITPNPHPDEADGG